MNDNLKTTRLQSKSSLKIILISLSVIYTVAQLAMPRLGYSLALNFDTSCYSGAISYLERVNTGNSSCGAGDDFVGFPFVANFAPNTALQKLLAVLLDSLPLVLGLRLLKRKMVQD